MIQNILFEITAQDILGLTVLALLLLKTVHFIISFIASNDTDF